MDSGRAQKIIERIRQIMAEQKDYLIEIDGRMGDGDLGLTMEKAFTAAADEIKDKDIEDAGKLFMKAGMVMAKAAPSTMGTLVATGFMRGGKGMSGETEAGELSTFFTSFVEGLMERGKSKPGEKTIIDALHPAAQALEKAAGEGIGAVEALEAALSAGRKGLEATKDMVAQHGRVAYYQDQSKGMEDPGATAGVFILRGFLDVFKE